jgi:hypothetical protein
MNVLLLILVIKLGYRLDFIFVWEIAVPMLMLRCLILPLIWVFMLLVSNSRVEFSFRDEISRFNDRFHLINNVVLRVFDLFLVLRCQISLRYRISDKTRAISIIDEVFARCVALLILLELGNLVVLLDYAGLFKLFRQVETLLRRFVERHFLLLIQRVVEAAVVGHHVDGRLEFLLVLLCNVQFMLEIGGEWLLFLLCYYHLWVV